MLKKVWEVLRKVDWLKVILTILKFSQKKPEVNPKYLVIKPRILSDKNLLRGLSALRTVLSVIPPTALEANLLMLGDVGFRIWKRIALQKGYDSLSIDPLGINVIILKLSLDDALKNQFGDLIKEKRWTEAAHVVDDFRFITDPNILSSKHPNVDLEYIQKSCSQNKEKLGEGLENLTQTIKEHRFIPTVDQNLKGALSALMFIFPALRDWALFSSSTFEEVMEIIDTFV